MSAWTIRTLRRDDAPQLLAFELANRDWFEQHIAPRAAGFYTRDGVLEHIEQFLAAHALGTLHPCVIVDHHGALIGRTNLKDINAVAGSAELGCRIALRHAGRGVASGALQQMIALARGQWALTRLFAYVACRNVASARVLERGGFRRGAEMHNLAAGTGVAVDGYQFSLDLGMLAFTE